MLLAFVIISGDVMPGITTCVPGFPRASHIVLLGLASCTEKDTAVIALLRGSTLFRQFPVGLLRLEGTMALHLPASGRGICLDRILGLLQTRV
jgi:hypothetical protein